MLKLQLVQGLLLGIQINIVIAARIPLADPQEEILDLSDYGPGLYGHRDYTIDEVLNNAYNSNDTDDINPEELGSYLEGDLLIPIDEDDDDKSPQNYNGKLSISSLWPGGLVPYVLNADWNRNQIRALLYAFDQLQEHSCIQFYPRTTEESYISFQGTKSGCFSTVGRKGGKQVLNLHDEHCFRPGTIIHELMHALGFSHEQKRYDRDKYVLVLFENIKKKSNFKKLSPKNSITYGIPYDYGSIIHYSGRASSKNKRPTIIPLRKLPKGVKMGQREGLSSYDVEKLRARYRCKARTLYQKIRSSLSLKH